MLRFIKFIIFAPIAIILIALSVANRQDVTLSLDPFGETPAIAFTFPLFWLIFGSLAAGVVIGGLVVWLKQGRFRKEARDQRFEAARARHEVKKVKETASAMSKMALPAPKA